MIAMAAAPSAAVESIPSEAAIESGAIAAQASVMKQGNERLQIQVGTTAKETDEDHGVAWVFDCPPQHGGHRFFQFDLARRWAGLQEG